MWSSLKEKITQCFYWNGNKKKYRIKKNCMSYLSNIISECEWLLSGFQWYSIVCHIIHESSFKFDDPWCCWYHSYTSTSAWSWHPQQKSTHQHLWKPLDSCMVWWCNVLYSASSLDLLHLSSLISTHGGLSWVLVFLI